MQKNLFLYLLGLYGMLLTVIFVVKLQSSVEVKQELSGSEVLTNAVVLEDKCEENLDTILGAERWIECERLSLNYRYNISYSEMEILCRIVQAEAGGEDMTGKILVANVILNRVDSPAFPNDIRSVVFQSANGCYQFSPIMDGRYYSVVISEETKEAVERALLGEDLSQGALYFVSRRNVAPDRMEWFDCNLTKVEEHGGHEFFR